MERTQVVKMKVRLRGKAKSDFNRINLSLKTIFLDQSDNEENKEAEEILDKRLVEGKEPWYLIKWKNSSQ